MAAAPEPTFFNADDHPTFELRDELGALLFRLVITTGLTGQLGRPDPFTWARTPFTSNWFPRGDGGDRQRPVTTLVGEELYPTVAAANADMAALKAALEQARELWWLEQKIADLNQYWPGSYRPEYIGNNARHVRHNLTLNTGRTLTAADLETVGAQPPLALVLPYIWPEAGDPETYAAPVTVDLAAALDGKPTRSGVIENLGSAPFELVLIEGATEHAPLVVLPQTSRDLMPGLTAVRIVPAAGEEAEPQLEVQS